MKKLLGIVVLGLLLSGNAYAGVGDKTFTLSQNYSDTEIERRIKKKLILSYKDSPQLDYIKEEDNKAGRSLVDRPDVNDDFQIHFI